MCKGITYGQARGFFPAVSACLPYCGLVREDNAMVKQEIKNFTLDIGEFSGLECTAPCSKYSVLLAHKLIGEPNEGMNAASAAVYASKSCTFTAEVDVSALMMSMKSVFLRFDGLDTVCRVELNGVEIAKTNSAHRNYSFDVKTKITIGKNILKLFFTPSVKDNNCRGVLSSFGTENSPTLSDCGIFRSAELVGFNHKVISGVKVKQIHTENQVRLDFSLNTLGYDDMSRAVATLTSPAGNVYFCGFMNGKGSITISEPNLWWPHGMGIQSLYRLNVNLYSESQIEDTYEMRIGLRTLEIVTNEAGKKILTVNGVPMLSMGAKYVPEDVLLPRITDSRTRALLETAKSANMNSVLVDAIGCYPDESFLCDCDELGLLVWQKIPLADSEAEDDAAFADEIKQEMLDNLTRMALHPSLGVIVGNDRLAKILASDEEKEALIEKFSDSCGMNVFDIDGSFTALAKCVSYDSIPSYESVVKFTDPHKRNLGSDVFELHGASQPRVINMLDRAYERFPYANGMKELYYVLGMNSAELCRLETENIRKSEYRYNGVFIERLNDTWPGVSPSGVDYYGVRKPLHYFEHRFFAPVHVMVEKQGNRVKFTVANATRSDYHGIFAYSIMDNKNRPVFKDSFPIKAKASENMEIHHVDLGSVIPSHENEYYLVYSVSDNVNEASRGVYLFTTLKRFEFLKPSFNVEITGNGTEYTLAVASDCFAKGVEISFPETDAILENNYFDITGKAPVRIKLKTARPITVEKLKRIITLRSIYDLGLEE